ncbi:MAG: hypothetical protein WC951_11595 [Bacteroidales bacterium]
MSRTTLLVIFFLTFTAAGYSQNTYLNERMSLKLGHSNTPRFWDFSDDITVGNIRLETNYVFFNVIESGLYVGYSNFKNIEGPLSPSRPTTFSSPYKSDALFYGLNTNFHILPFVIREGRVRIDLYVGAKLGMISMIAPANSLYNGTVFDYGLLGGVNYFIAKNWGIYVEYGVSKRVYYSDTEPCLRYGIIVKL